jgi:hypothetical protein
VIFEPNRALNISTAVKPRKRVDEMSRQICEQFELILRCPDEEKKKREKVHHTSIGKSKKGVAIATTSPGTEIYVLNE